MTFYDNLCDYGRILRVLKCCGENNYPPSLIFTTENPHSKLFFGRTFSIANRFSKFLQHILGQTKRYFCKENSLYQLNEIEDIREIPLSESRNYTLTFCR